MSANYYRNYYRKVWDIVGYIYRVGVYCPSCLVKVLVDDGTASPGAWDMPTEQVLSQIAGANAIDRDDERTFDSADFPKVLFAWEDEGETCGLCHETL
jgi:hypothetical protein